MSKNVVNVEKMVLYIHKPQGWFDYKMITRWSQKKKYIKNKSKLVSRNQTYTWNS